LVCGFVVKRGRNQISDISDQEAGGRLLGIVAEGRKTKKKLNAETQSSQRKKKTRVKRRESGELGGKSPPLQTKGGAPSNLEVGGIRRETQIPKTRKVQTQDLKTRKEQTQDPKAREKQTQEHSQE
jgi:hypothetical protein